MATLINLDITNTTKVTDYGLQVNEKPLPIINFLIRDEHYAIDYSNFIRLRLKIEKEFTKEVTTIDLTSANLVTEGDRTYVQWIVPDVLLADLDKLNIDASVTMINETYWLQRFKIILYTGYSFQMQAVLTLIRNFNNMYASYIDSVKRTEIGQPNGVIPLNSEGRISGVYLNPEWGKHITNTIYDTLNDLPEIHGLRINKINYQWEYYDTDDEYWYQVNSVPGGMFGFPNKPSDMDVYGGDFTVGQNYIVGGTLGDDVSSGIDAMTFNDNLTEGYTGGTFGQTVDTANYEHPPIFGGTFM